MASQSRLESTYLPTASWDILRLRARLLKQLRAFFDQRDFLEVETPLLSADTVVDIHLDPLAVTLFEDPRRRERGPTYWLQTSPEFAMKRLLAAGGKALYQVTRAFRGGERGDLHNPEFTIVEWYRVEDGLEEGMNLLDDLAQELLGRGPAERLSYRDAFQRHAGIDPLETTSDDLVRLAREMGLHVPLSGPPLGPLPTGDSEAQRDTWLNFLLAECVEPHLGMGRPTILFDYPASQAALARVRAEHPPVAERFELYVDGIELANGYHELTDAEELRRRHAVANQLRLQDGKYPLPEGSRLLHAMEVGLPDCCGVALGFDRLVMVASGAKSVRQVLAFPIDRA